MQRAHTQAPRPHWRFAIAITAFVFGAVTIKSGGSVLFIDGADRAAAGAYVPFVLWFNFGAGFTYLAAAIGIFLWKSWAAPLAMVIAVATLSVFLTFGIHIVMGGAFELRTVYAMTLRSFMWLTFAVLLIRAKPG